MRTKAGGGSVDVYAWSPDDAHIAMHKWLPLGYCQNSSKYQLHIEWDENLWGKPDADAYVQDKWNNLWSTMSNNHLLPCVYANDNW